MKQINYALSRMQSMLQIILCLEGSKISELFQLYFCQQFEIRLKHHVLILFGTNLKTKMCIGYTYKYAHVCSYDGVVYRIRE